MDLPFWVYLIVVGIFFSAYMTVKTAKEERELELEWIEKEGEIYMERMEAEKERRKGENKGEKSEEKAMG